MRQLLLDYMPFHISAEQINESLSKNNGNLIVKGVLQRANIRNQNGRVYPREILEREIEKYNREFVAQNRALGQLDHPQSAIVELQNSSHIIMEIKWEGDDVVGTVKVLTTPTGNILKELFKHGITIGISSRGVGSVKEVYENNEASTEVQDDFELIAFDFVSNPSTHGAFLRPVNESTIVNMSSYDKAHLIISQIICDMGCKCELN